MKIGLIAGIFGSPPEYRALNLQETTETILQRELEARGHEVCAQSHALWNDLSGLDVLHVHHLANSCVQLPLRPIPPLVFTRHATKDIALHHRLVLAGTYRRSDALVALSQWEAGLLRDAGVKARVEVIYNGIDDAAFTPPEQLRCVVEGRPFEMLYVGQVIELKRVHLAVEALAALLAERPGADPRLTIVSNRETLRAQVERRAAELGVAERVVFAGPRGKLEVAETMRRSHVLMVPSRTEALSTVVTEAMFSALPVVGFQVGGIREQVPAQWPTPQVPQTEELNRLLVSTYDDYSRVAQVFAEHAPVARARFSIPAMVDQHLALYEDVVSGTRKGGPR